MEEIIGILEGTPWWVYLLFAYLVAMGVKALHPRTVPIKKLIIFPAVLTIWGLMGLKWSLPIILAWAISLAVGFALGWLSVRKWKIRSDRGRGTLYLLGSWTTLILALLFFAIKYAFGFYSSIHLDIPREIHLAQSAASGIITGTFIGRLALFWKKYKE